MQPNVFKISHRIGIEDKFTASLAYLLNRYPRFGQAYWDKICELCGLKTCKFIEAIDHPSGDADNRPDMLLAGSKLEILCEHKLDSCLGMRQIERYLSLAKKNKQKLVLVANETLGIVPEVLRSKAFLRPREQGRKHLVWSDFYDLTGKFQNGLIKEFREYMDSLGMNPYTWPGHGDPFVNAEAREKFRYCLSDLKRRVDAVFGESRGRLFRRCKSVPAIELRKPIQGVHLIFLSINKPSDLLSWFDIHVKQAMLSFRLFVKHRKLMSKRDGEFDTSLGKGEFFWLDNISSWDENLYQARIYLFPLPKILNISMEKTRKNIEVVTVAVLKHVRDIVG